MIDRKAYERSSDIAKRFRVTLEDNETTVKLINGEIDYQSLPFSDLNEIRKGSIILEQADFIKSHQGEEILCEALDMNPCVMQKCQLYVSEGARYPMENRHGIGFCGEFKIAFKKK